MLAHAISSTTPAAACQITRNGPIASSPRPRVSDSTVTGRFLLVSGNSVACRATTARHSSRASASVRPGASRAKVISESLLRSAHCASV